MIDRCLDQLIRTGQWIGADMRRVHVLMVIFDLFALLLLVLVVMDFWAAYQSIGKQAAFFEHTRARAGFFVGPAIWFFHLIMTKRGNRSFKKYIVPIMVGLAVGLIIFGYATSNWLIGLAEAKGYQLCTYPSYQQSRTRQYYAHHEEACPILNNFGNPEGDF